MKLGPVTKLDKRNTAISKKLTMTLCRKIVTSLSFFRFLANLEQYRSRIPDARSIKLTFSLTATFYLQKLKRELRNLLHSSHTIALCKVTIWFFLQRNADISKINGVFVLKSKFFWNYIRVCIYLPNFKFLTKS